MLNLDAILVVLVVFACEFIETWFSYPMTTRPLVVGTAIGIALGDIQAGVSCGASLELVFMGVMAIGGTVPPDACAGTAVGTAYAILLGQGIETAFTLAIRHLFFAKCCLFHLLHYVHYGVR